ncbi:hypothetical protein ASPACDRAFT_1891578 [Aspergillus aculeatus ATCC 16872]|uniref:Enoyl reductase (ER) domain-containing protein n=1 Tax=Aspergillus aculeatus (strain ATCC 16872 / CBS 172.66 / WB 5094) TaxID=690307 RepID=A0A1L9WHV0_ASPA1|nr:uncharacterized protein ASPACDRAFT_1891578 [Aspergillus aculeatus ATCC 16872]OJJ95751.1 hypothetical protein ASPACDRAFT_1891578 [Aspergillus aculeatus ATCC 16872]
MPPHRTPIDTPEPIPPTMKTYTFAHPGPPSTTLHLNPTHPTPTLSTETSLLIRISHMALHPGATHMMQLLPAWTQHFPAVPETDFSGIVLSTGTRVPLTPPPPPDAHRFFPPGTAVFGSISVGQHLKNGTGALTEYLVVEMGDVARKPEGVSVVAAAGLGVSGVTALALVDVVEGVVGPLEGGERVLVNGACGGVGHFVAQMLASRAGLVVVGACSRESGEVARGMGCVQVVDYRGLEGRIDRGNGEEEEEEEELEVFHAIIDAYGSQGLWYAAGRWLKPDPGHVCVSVGPALEAYTFRSAVGVLVKQMLNRFLPVWLGGIDRQYRQVTAWVDAKRLERLRVLAEEGVLKT